MKIYTTTPPPLVSGKSWGTMGLYLNRIFFEPIDKKDQIWENKK
jgi:hypothetical protein